MKLISNNFVQSLGPETDVLSILASLKNDFKNQDPFYVCKLSEIIGKYQSWKMMYPRVKPFYGVDTNSSCIVLDTLAELGVGFECTTKKDMIQAASVAGANPIFLSVPLKTANLIKHAASSAVHLMTFDSESDLEKIKAFYPQAKLLIHIRSSFEEEMLYDFGCDPSTGYTKLLKMAGLLNLNVVGIHFNIEPEGNRDAYASTIELARQLFDAGASLGYDFNCLSLGRGFPPDSLNELADEINAALGVHFPDDSVDIIANPAQFFVESAYTLSCQIEYVRQVEKVDPVTETPYVHYEYFINDGVFGSFSSVLSNKQNFKLKPLNEYPMSETYSSSIWGPTGNISDQIVEEVSLPEMKIGDSIIFDNMGFFTTSSHNGFPIQKVYVLADEDICGSNVGKIEPSTKEIYFVMGNNTEKSKVQRKRNCSFSAECFDQEVNLVEILQLDQCNVLQ